MRKFVGLLLPVIAAAILLTSAACSCEEKHTHDMSISETVVSPTCISEGAVVYRCSGCDYSEIKTLPVLEHDYEEKYTPPTCVSPGIRERKCSVCGDTETEIIAPSDHAFTETVKEADCVARGYVLRRCENCGYSEIEYTAEAKGHVFEQTGEIRGACTEPFIEIYKCSECGVLENRESDKIAGHVFLTEVKQSTCVQEGYEEKKCVYCSFSERVVLPASGHKFATEKQSATCCEKGSIIKYCVNPGCGIIEQEITLDYAAHIMSVIVDGEERFVYSRDGINVYSDPDCVNQISASACNDFGGGMHFLCVRSGICGMAVPAEEHTMSPRDTATCTQPGEYNEVCVKCGYATPARYSPAKGHNSSSVHHLCAVDEMLTAEYHALGGDDNISICYRCPDCREYIPSVPHRPDKEISQVSCDNPQSCLECGALLAVKEHTAPELTCVSAKGDGYYYCSVCKDYPMGELTEHQYVFSGEIPATCTQDRICIYKCACGRERSDKVADTALGHESPPGQYECVADADASAEYYALYGEHKDIAGKCLRCGEFIEVKPHKLSCELEDVTCLNNQHCTVCGEIFAEKPHEMPEFTCISIKNDGYYYCKSCRTVPLGKVTPHDYTIETDRFEATCSENARIYYRCVCGAADPDGYKEEEGTMLGHRLPVFAQTAGLNCRKGHLLRFESYRCQNAGCNLDFSFLTDKNGEIYCLDINTYLYENGFADDFIADESTGTASDAMVISMLSCCRGSGYRFVPRAHILEPDPVALEDITVEGVFYRYVPSTCATHGSALFRCMECYAYVYAENTLPLDKNNHAGEILACNEHCAECAPEDAQCAFAFEILVYRGNGEEAIENGLKKSSVYSIGYMSANNRMTEVSDPVTGETYYKLTDSCIAEIILSNGPCFATADAALREDHNYLFDWSEVKLRKNAFNSITIYITGVNSSV